MSQRKMLRSSSEHRLHCKALGSLRTTGRLDENDFFTTVS